MDGEVARGLVIRDGAARGTVGPAWATERVALLAVAMSREDSTLLRRFMEVAPASTEVASTVEAGSTEVAVSTEAVAGKRTLYAR